MAYGRHRVKRFVIDRILLYITRREHARLFSKERAFCAGFLPVYAKKTPPYSLLPNIPPSTRNNVSSGVDCAFIMM